MLCQLRPVVRGTTQGHPDGRGAERAPHFSPSPASPPAWRCKGGGAPLRTYPFICPAFLPDLITLVCSRYLIYLIAGTLGEKLSQSSATRPPATSLQSWPESFCQMTHESARRPALRRPSRSHPGPHDVLSDESRDPRPLSWALLLVSLSNLLAVLGKGQVAWDRSPPPSQETGIFE